MYPVLVQEIKRFDPLQALILRDSALLKNAKVSQLVFKFFGKIQLVDSISLGDFCRMKEYPRSKT